ncbi:MAG TPA: choice-of-anchor tandem repeat GloVer-containing protein [Verrucomicrobiae bacterium]|nr:choice-of-anchor tandem repeat GloVer-containing protein [Verrucomicrobiae bacterium]
MKFIEAALLATVVLAACLVTSDAYGDVVTYSTVFEFGGTNGAYPNAGLVQDSNGNFYGTTFLGGTNGNNGTVFRVTTNGTFTSLVSLNFTNGSGVAAGLIQGSDGCFYSTAYQGGISNYGTIFKVTADGAITNLFAFPSKTNAYPKAGLMQASNGIFYGTTFIGGTNGGNGTVFQITSNGAFRTILSFNNTNGAFPLCGLIQASDGNIYGTTSGGLTNVSFYGTVFKLTTNGILTTLVSFDGTNGAYPYAGLIQAQDGTLYGTTRNGGTNGDYGTVFKLTTNGNFSTLISFGNTNGANPAAALVQGGDGDFYGTTEYGGTNGPGFGTIFKLSTNGVLTTLFSFNNSNGAFPIAALVQGSDGDFYGTTSAGGTSGSNNGFIFRLAITAISPPVIQTVDENAGVLSFTWSAVSNLMYQPQYSTNLASSGWFNLGSVLTASNSSLTASDPATNLHRFYRVLLLP